MARQRNFANEQSTRIRKNMEKGYSKAQAYGKPNKGELKISQVEELEKMILESDVWKIKVSRKVKSRNPQYRSKKNQIKELRETWKYSDESVQELLQDLKKPIWPGDKDERFEIAKNYILLLTFRRYARRNLTKEIDSNGKTKKVVTGSGRVLATKQPPLPAKLFPGLTRSQFRSRKPINYTEWHSAILHYLNLKEDFKNKNILGYYH